METLVALWTGVVCGLALAVPLGAIGVLLIQEGASRGWRRGAAAAAAVATVDTLYCVAAVTVGSVLAPVVSSWDPWPTVIGGSVLVAIAVRGILLTRRVRTGGAPDPAPGTDPSWRRFALFFGLTAVNPATLVYFAAVVAGLSGVVGAPSTAALFTVGVAAASLAWQLLLVLVGTALRRRTGTRHRRLTGLLGNGIVGVLGLLMIGGVIG